NINGTGNGLANRLQGNAGNNSLNGGNGNDVLLGGNGHDRLIGGGNADKLRGDAGNDVLRGGTGADALFGGAGNDRLYGDGGADKLTGNGGSDQMFGGAGQDVFIFNSIADSRPGATRDRIEDFTRGEDIDLRAIDANTRAGGNQAFDFNGTTAAANSVWYVQRGDDALVRADVNGDRIADLEILLNDVSTLRAGDFLL
ncbi:MAG: calcium-binding protein, partial [Paracoccus sp. (in: a-proteobacteria)]